MHRIVFLTLSFKSLLLSVVKQKRTSNYLSVISIGETGICSCLLQSNPCEIFFMLCKSLRHTLNALLQATMLRIRATNRTIVGYVRCARFPQMQALASLFACGQPLKTTHRVVSLTLSFKSLLLSIEKQKRTSKHLSVLFGGETGICEIA